MKRCFIFAAGSFYGLRERPAPGDFVIAADAGYRICQRENLRPDILLGDFDSMEPPCCSSAGGGPGGSSGTMISSGPSLKTRR